MDSREGKVETNVEPRVNASTYQMTLAGMVLPIRWHLLADAIGAASVLFLGHPVIALFGFISC
jgi:hypothetical protein